MDESEFNLSVIEDAVGVSSPLKIYANYETIVGLIKEKIDINTEDETDQGKVHELGSSNTKNYECPDSEVFKSPAKNSLTRVKSSRGTKRRSYDVKKTERTIMSSEPRRTRSLGAVKPGRTDQRKRGCSSASHSSDTSGPYDWTDNTLEPSEPVVDRDTTMTSDLVENGNLPASAQSAVDTSPEIPAELKSTRSEKTPDRDEGLKSTSETGRNELPAFTSSPPSSPKLTQGADFVESSQSTTNSDLQSKLMNNSKSKISARLNGENSRDSVGEFDEEEAHNFSLTFSPTSKSQASGTPLKLRKRRGSTSVVEGIGVKIRKTNSLRNTKSSPERSQSAGPSPLKGLTQELENCMTSSDYEQMSEDIQSDIPNHASFTFETIDLLNDYEDSNERVNNRILSKIFSSPTSTKVKKEASGTPETRGRCDQQVIENPLRIEDETIRPESRKSKVGKSAKKSASKKSDKRGVKKSSKMTDAKENVAPRRKSNETKSTTTENLEIETNDISTTERTESTEENKVFTEEKERRHSARLAIKTPMNMEIDELEDDEDLAVEAANVSRRIEEAARRMITAKQTLAKLKDMDIRLRHEVLPQHEIESRAGSKALTFAQQKEFLQYATLSKETYSPAEDEIICSNWNAFCQDHDWDPENFEPFLKLKHGDELIMNSLMKRRLFVQFLANGLPNRPLCSVYNRFKTLYGKHSSTGARYTRKEDMQILAYMLHKPADNPDKKCSDLAKVLDRTRESISKRYKKLMRQYCQKNENKVLKKVQWNLSLAGQFITTLLEVTRSSNTMELKDAFIPKVVWLKMEERMKIDNQLLKRFWEQQLHLQLFAEEPLYLNRIKVMLIEHMYTKQIWHPAEIKWQHIVRNFDGFTISFLRKIFNHLTEKTSEKIQTRNFKKILDWLYTKKIENLLNGPKDKCLPRIFYKDKKALIRTEDVTRLRSNSENSDTSELHL